jgi:hypothetical protein
VKKDKALTSDPRYDTVGSSSLRQELFEVYLARAKNNNGEGMLYSMSSNFLQMAHASAQWLQPTNLNSPFQRTIMLIRTRNVNAKKLSPTASHKSKHKNNNSLIVSTAVALAWSAEAAKKHSGMYPLFPARMFKRPFLTYCL